MIKLNGCPRCHGALFPGDMPGDMNCLQCGFRQYGNTPSFKYKSTGFSKRLVPIFEGLPKVHAKRVY